MFSPWFAHADVGARHAKASHCSSALGHVTGSNLSSQQATHCGRERICRRIILPQPADDEGEFPLKLAAPFHAC